MRDYFHLYMKVDCNFCRDAVTLLEKERRNFVITVMDHCPLFVEGVKKEYNFPTVPIVLRCYATGEVKLIGGYTELDALITAEKKEKTTNDKV